MRKLAGIALAFAAACFGDSLVSVGAGDAGRAIRLEVGQKLDIDQRQCAGFYNDPAISTPAVEFTGSNVVENPPTPGCHTARFHFIGRNAGTAIVIFRWTAQAPDSVTYTVDVH